MRHAFTIAGDGPTAYSHQERCAQPWRSRSPPYDLGLGPSRPHARSPAFSTPSGRRLGEPWRVGARDS